MYEVRLQFKDPGLLALARIPDVQGLGGHAGYERRGRLVAEN
jgi:hypothetical protein